MRRVLRVPGKHKRRGPEDYLGRTRGGRETHRAASFSLRYMVAAVSRRARSSRRRPPPCSLALARKGSNRRKTCAREEGRTGDPVGPTTPPPTFLSPGRRPVVESLLSTRSDWPGGSPPRTVERAAAAAQPAVQVMERQLVDEGSPFWDDHFPGLVRERQAGAFTHVLSVVFVRGAFLYGVSEASTHGRCIMDNNNEVFFIWRGGGREIFAALPMCACQPCRRYHSSHG